MKGLGYICGLWNVCFSASKSPRIEETSVCHTVNMYIAPQRDTESHMVMNHSFLLCSSIKFLSTYYMLKNSLGPGNTRRAINLPQGSNIIKYVYQQVTSLIKVFSHKRNTEKHDSTLKSKFPIKKVKYF